MRKWLLFAVLLSGIAGPASAQETTIQNDVTVGGTPSTPLNNFVASEEAAAWLTSTCNGTLVATQVHWASVFGSSGSTVEAAIRVYDGSTHPTPGSTLATITLPSLTEAILNEFRFLDPPTNSTPLAVPVTSGQTIAVSLEHLNGNSGSAFAGAVTYDAATCTPGLNAAHAIPGGWVDGCATGIPGNLVIRAVIDCAESVAAIPRWPRYGLVLGLLILTALALRARTPIEQRAA